jgi:hypothetical protein
MRVIQTEFYFDPESVKSSVPRRMLTPSGSRFKPSSNPGVAVAWFGLNYVDLSDVDSSEILSGSQLYLTEDAKIISSFIDFSIRERRGVLRPSVLQNAFIENPGIVEYVLNAEVVIERSPPTVELLKNLARSSPSVAIGSYIGVGSAHGSYPLMMITVPLGIIVVGSAIGVSQGLRRGLNKSIERAVKRIGRGR